MLTLTTRQNGRHFAEDTFNRIFENENVRISINFSLKFVRGQINNIPALVQIMAWRLQATNHHLNQWTAPSHYLNQWWLVYWRIYASLGLNELRIAWGHTFINETIFGWTLYPILTVDSRFVPSQRETLGASLESILYISVLQPVYKGMGIRVFFIYDYCSFNNVPCHFLSSFNGTCPQPMLSRMNAVHCWFRGVQPTSANVQYTRTTFRFLEIWVKMAT